MPDKHNIKHFIYDGTLYDGSAMVIPSPRTMTLMWVSTAMKGRIWSLCIKIHRRDSSELKIHCCAYYIGSAVGETRIFATGYIILQTWYYSPLGPQDS